jgi:hypothetical protein
MALKPEVLQTATDPSKLQTMMKADLKARLGKNGVKFIAAKNCLVGAKNMSLFIVTDTPNDFEAVIKAKFPKAYRAKGTCDVMKVEKSNLTQVVIRTSTGQMTPNAVADLIGPGLGDASILSSFGATTEPTNLKQVSAPNRSGVPDWAKEDYKAEAVATVIASMTSDKKIGSIYFEDEGRIRTTHAGGPKSSQHGETVQFNISRDGAWAAFMAENKGKLKTVKDPRPLYKSWIKETLGKATATSIPSWAKLVKGPQTGLDVGNDAPPDDTQLIEIFKGINGRVEGWHPSRGAAVKFVTDKQTISVLKAAIKYIDGQGTPKITKLTDPKARNKAFYDFVKKRLPNFVPLLREPSEF